LAADRQPDIREPVVTGPGDRPAVVSDSVLSVRNLRTEFSTQGATVAAVRDVSLELGRGQRIAIVGESGSGKSALALSVLGLIEPPGRVIGGEVILNGRDIARLREREMDAIRGKEISVVFQDPMTALDPVKTIGSQVIEAIRKHQSGLRRRAARRLAAELLRDVEVPSAERRLDQYPHEYSGGMRQRVMIAIALANQPDVLIADEPTTALDVTTQAQVMDLLSRAAAERGAAVILITHNLGVVAGFCDVVLVMYAGRLVERAPTDVLFAHPTHPYTEALLRCVPRPDRLERGPLVAIPGLPPNLAELPPGCSFAARCPVGSDKDICHTTTPPTVQTVVEDYEVTAECHFAQARSQQHASVLPTNSQ
jgi:oligopeptide/dipeptide ABC transporter ATP-binding protein